MINCLETMKDRQARPPALSLSSKKYFKFDDEKERFFSVQEPSVI